MRHSAVASTMNSVLSIFMFMSCCTLQRVLSVSNVQETRQTARSTRPITNVMQYFAECLTYPFEFLPQLRQVGATTYMFASGRVLAQRRQVRAEAQQNGRAARCPTAGRYCMHTQLVMDADLRSVPAFLLGSVRQTYILVRR